MELMEKIKRMAGDTFISGYGFDVELKKGKPQEYDAIIVTIRMDNAGPVIDVLHIPTDFNANPCADLACGMKGYADSFEPDNVAAKVFMDSLDENHASLDKYRKKAEILEARLYGFANRLIKNVIEDAAYSSGECDLHDTDEKLKDAFMSYMKDIGLEKMADTMDETEIVSRMYMAMNDILRVL